MTSRVRYDLALIAFCVAGQIAAPGCSNASGGGDPVRQEVAKDSPSATTRGFVKWSSINTLAVGAGNLSSASASNDQISGCTRGRTSLARFFPADKPSVSACCHALLYYGLGPTDLRDVQSGVDLLSALTDEQAATALFGKAPFFSTRHGLRYYLVGDPIFSSDLGESHRDQCLATFATLGLPLETPISLGGKRFSIADFLAESVANFSFKQQEWPWTLLAYAAYLPPRQGWEDRFAKKTSFSEATIRLIDRNLNNESCAGLHVFQTLIWIQRADECYRILDDSARLRLDDFITQIVHDATRRQRDDGSWDHQWCSSVRPSLNTSTLERLLVTGHLTEALCTLSSQYRPRQHVYLRSADWLEKALVREDTSATSDWICPTTHAARSLLSIQSNTMPE